MILIDIVLALFAVVVFSILITGILHLFVLRVPYVPTPGRVAAEMVRFARLRGDEKVYDLGAGDGKILVMAKRAYPGLTAVGVELVPTVWLLGRVYTWLSGAKVDFRLQNALTADLRDADTVFLYVTPFLMEQLEPKLDRELKKGAVVVSHTFHFPHRKPTEEVKIPWHRRGKTLVRYVY